MTVCAYVPILELLPQLYNKFLLNTYKHTHAHLHLDPTPPLLIYFIDVPDVSHHGVGTSLQAPSGQGQLDAELLHVGGLGDGRQSVGAPAQQEVTEGSLNGGHVRGEKVLLNLG